MLNNIMESHVQLNAIFVGDKDGGFTGYFVEFPEAIAEGETEQEVESKLIESLKIILDYRREESEELCILNHEPGSTKTTKIYNLDIA